MESHLNGINKTPNNDHGNSSSMQQQITNDPMLVLDRMALENGAVDLGLGFPDYSPPKHIIDALIEAASGKDCMLHHYTRPYGHPRLVNVLAKLYSKLLSIELDPIANIVTTIGAFQGLSSICDSLINRGDEVILLEPFYAAYQTMLEMRGAVPVYVPLRPGKGGFSRSCEDWKLDKKELENAITPKTKAIFLNNPMNPLGKVFEEDELKDISEVCIQHDLLCVSDEVYQWLTYDGKKHIRIAAFPNMFERTITVGSAGKSFNVTGWKVGWCLGPRKLIHFLQNCHFSTIRTSPSILQEAVAVAFEKNVETLSYFRMLSKEMEGKRNKLSKHLDGIGIPSIVPDGGCYIIADISDLIGDSMDKTKKADEALDYRFAKWAVKEKGLCVMPFSIFYSREHQHLAQNHVRMCFVKTDGTLDKAKHVLENWNQKNGV